MEIKPEMRFEGYTEDWEQRQLSDISETFSGGTPSVGKSEYYGGSIPFIRSAEINSDSTELSLTEKGLENSSARLVSKGDILYALYGATSGEVGICKVDGAINQAILAIQPKKEIDSNYLNQWFRTHKNSIVSTYLQGGQGNLSGQIIKGLEIELPVSEEQQKIGSFLRTLDDTITLQQQKLRKLELLKESLLSMMFVQPGQTAPEMRFEGYTEDWEQRKFSDVATLLNGRAYSQNELLETGKYPVLRVGNFYTNDSWYYSNLELDSKYYADNGDLLYTWSATFGPQVWYGGKVIYHYHIWKIALSEKLNREFAVQLLEQDKESILADKNGSTMAHITKSVLENKFFSMPSVQEQQQIGSFFQHLDQTITLHQRKLRKLQKIKEASLELMFPQNN